MDKRGNVVGAVAAKLNVAAALATSGALPENVNYAVNSSLLLSFLESVPEVAAKLKEPSTKDCKFEDVVESAEKAAVLVLVYWAAWRQPAHQGSLSLGRAAVFEAGRARDVSRLVRAGGRA